MAASELNDDDASPLHVACGLTSSAEDDRKPRKLAVISALLEAYPAATALKTKAEGYLPLHVACKYKANADVVGALLAKGKGTEKVTSKQLFLPLHLALDFGAPHASSAALLKAYPGAAAIANPEGRLPLHLALAPTKASQAPEDLVRTIFELNPAAARVRDNEDMEPLVRLQKRIKDTGSSGAYSGELLGQIMMRCLPFDPATGEAHAATGVGEAPCYVWHAVLADCEDKLVAGVDEVLRLCPSRVEALAFSLDSHGRRAIDRATPRCKAAIIRRLFLCGRFELSPGPPEHVSATSIVRFATDYAKEAAPAAPEAASPTPPATLGSEGGSPVAAASAPAAPAEQLPLVCLKFLKHRENFKRELEARRCPLHGETSPDHVVPILASFDGMSDPDFAEELAGRGLSSHPYLLVFPAGDRPLSAVIDHERETKDWEEEVRSCAAALSVGLAHLHSRGVIHGDVKPRNVVRVGRRYKLIDLDASTRFGEEVGIKTSTALAPPELLCVGATGKVVVRSSAAGGGGGGGGGGEAANSLLAHPSFDVWMLGATLYHMLTGATLLHATASDNAADEAQLRLAAEWAAEDKASKLAAVQPPRARHLLSLLLSRDQALRPSAERVAQHPFITGKQAVRLSGEVPAFDVFLSYRVASEAPLAQALYEKLVALGCRVWWDKRCLSLGKDWREGFCGGLATSRAFVALLSRGAVAAREAATQKPLAGRNWGADALNRGSPCDNVLLEHRLALELAHPERGLLEFIIPVFIGDPSEGDPELHDKWGASCAPVPNDESCAAVDEELARQLDKQGLGAPFDSALGTAAVWRAVGGKQGHFVAGRRGNALDAVAKAIWEALQGPPPGAPAAPLTIAIPAEEGSEAVAGACAGGGEAAAAAAQARNKELTLSVRTLQEEARALRGRVAQTEALQAQTEALRAHVAALEGAAAAARSGTEGLQARLVRAEAAAAAAAPPPAPARAAPDPALASELGEARRLLEKGAAEAAELRRSAAGAKAEEERLRAALALASGRVAALEQELAARPAPAPPAGTSAEEERLRAALALSADKAAALERELAASAARAGALEARGAGAVPSPHPYDSEAAEPYAPASPLGRPLLAAASPSGRHRLAASGGGAGAGLLEQAVSEQQTFSAQLQGQLLVQGQLIMSLQRDVSGCAQPTLRSAQAGPFSTLHHTHTPSQIMELRGSLRR
jgi:serine/threonine protein kinase